MKKKTCKNKIGNKLLNEHKYPTKMYENIPNRKKLQILVDNWSVYYESIKSKSKKTKGKTSKNARKLMKTKFSGSNFIKGINTWAVFLVSNSGSFLKVELRNIDNFTRKLITNKAFHLKDNVDILNMIRKEKKVGRELTNPDVSKDTKIQGLKEYASTFQ